MCPTRAGQLSHHREQGNQFFNLLVIVQFIFVNLISFLQKTLSIKNPVLVQDYKDTPALTYVSAKQ